MKADHRHELKTNELADWLANLPEWLRENRSTLVASAAIIVVAVAVYFWIFYQRNIASARGQVRLTNLVTQLPGQKAGLARAMGQQNDQSFLLIDLAKDLQDFGQSTHNKEMSALALIERGDTLRTELHYRSGQVDRDYVAKQIALAQASYNQALEKAADYPALAAKARFGLGLCEEELGNVGKAKEIYREMAGNAAYDGTAAKAAAAFRLKTMDDYQGVVAFKPAPPQPQPQAQAPVPTVRLKPGQASVPAVVSVPSDTNAAPAPVPIGPAPEPSGPPAGTAPAPTVPAPQPGSPPAGTTPAPAPQANSPTGG
jgi:tetratricopeptide (TPR) repeat protein